MQTFPVLTQFDFHHALEETRGLAVVYFSSSSCASCGYWRKVLDAYHEVHPEVEIFEVDAKRDLALAEEFNLFHLPALFLYVDGAFHSDLQCEAGMDKLEAAIEAALMRPAQELP